MNPSPCNPTLAVRVLFFSVLQDITGCQELRWELTAPATLGGLWAELELRWPPLRGWHGSVLMAVDCRYEKSGALLQDGAEVAFMPPVQGG